jgi:hypothetical protein
MLNQSDVAQAQLIIESGNVQIKHEGETWITAQNGMLLYQSDSIKTGNNSSASVVLFRSSIIRLDNNTEITIQEIIKQTGVTNVKIKQDAGRTWNTVIKISGIDNYDVQTPTTVASVRGTSFDVNVSPNGKTVIGVGLGNVTIKSIVKGHIGDIINAKKGESVTVDPNEIDKPLKTKSFKKDSWILKNQKKDTAVIQSNESTYINESINVKRELYKRIDPYIPELKEKYGVNDEELEILIDGYLRGYYDLPPETPDWIREIVELS